MRALALFVLAACGGSKPSTNPIDNAGASGLPAAYAKVCTEQKLDAPATLVVTEAGEAGPIKDESTGTIRCTVSQARPIKNGTACLLACGGDFAQNLPLPSGTLVATSDGLWLADAAFDGDLAKLDAADRLLAATPVAGRTEHKKPDDTEAGAATVVEAYKDGWCVAQNSWGGDESGSTLCLQGGTFVGGHGYWAGGSTRDLYFGDVKKP